MRTSNVYVKLQLISIISMGFLVRSAFQCGLSKDNLIEIRRLILNLFIINWYYFSDTLTSNTIPWTVGKPVTQESSKINSRGSRATMYIFAICAVIVVSTSTPQIMWFGYTLIWNRHGHECSRIWKLSGNFIKKCRDFLGRDILGTTFF